MTHDGPQGSATTLDKTTLLEEKSDIIFGSQHLYTYLKDNQGKVVVNIHGHVHDGAPMDKVENVKICNPGSLKYGEFAEMVLRENADGTWKVSQYNKHYL